MARQTGTGGSIPMPMECAGKESQSSSNRQPQKRTLGFSVISILLGFAAPLLVLEVALRFLPVSTSTGTMVVDDDNPIVRFTPNQSFTFSKGWRFSLVNTGRINNYGFINDQDYGKPDKQGPLVIIGDSYVEAMMVPYRQTVQGRLAKLLERNRNVYSLGISGSQLAQYLAFAEYACASFDPHALVFVIVGNDFEESLLTYSREEGYYHFHKNDGDPELKLVRVDYQPSLGKRLLRESALVRYLWGTVGIADLARWGEPEARYVGNTAATASEQRLADSRLVVDRFFAELPKRVRLNKSHLLFVMDAMRPEIYSPSDLQRAQGSYFDLMRQYFLQQAEKNGYEAIDMQPRFISRHQKDGSRFEFAIDAHWNAVGHEVAADAIASSRVFETVLSP